MKLLIVQDHRITGGAAKAAWRLGEALHRWDHEVVHVCGDEVNRAPRQALRLNGKPKRGPARWLDALRPDPAARRRRVLEGWKKILDETQPERIWFHNLAGGIKWGWTEELIPLGLQRCPCLWTLHDMWALGGGESYFPEDRGPQEYANSPLRRLVPEVHAGRLRIVAPSAWLASLFTRLTGCPADVMPNPLDREIFRPFDKAAARAAWGFSPEQTVSLAVAENLGDRRKGMAFLLKAWEQVRRDTADVLCLVGRRPPGVPEIPGLRFSGTILSTSELATLYSAADLFLHPAEIDNAPCVIQESLACGCPVLSRPNGGIPEMLREEKGGYVAGDPEFARTWRQILQKHGPAFPLADFRKREQGPAESIDSKEFRENLRLLLPPARREPWRVEVAGPGPHDLDLREGGGDLNLYHWMAYQLPAILILERQGRAFGKVLVSGPAKEFHTHSLRSLGIADERVERIGRDTPRENTCRVQVCPPASGEFDELYRELGSRLTSSARGPGAGRNIYITRRDATKRLVANERELVQALRRRGFVVVCPGEIPWPEQVAVFREAECIVGPHGAAFTNILFSRPGCRLVELFPAEENVWYFQRMAENVGVRHSAFQGAPSQKIERKREGFTVPIRPLMVLLDELGLP